MLIPSSRAAALMLLLLLANPLCGCVYMYPILPGPKKYSRTNVPEQLPAWIVAGQTTRRDVLHRLGEPDERRDDDAWFGYDSAIGHWGAGGGVKFVPGASGDYGGLEAVEYRRLVVQFTENGLVSAANLEEKTCASWSSGGRIGLPCIKAD